MPTTSGSGILGPCGIVRAAGISCNRLTRGLRIRRIPPDASYRHVTPQSVREQQEVEGPRFHSGAHQHLIEGAVAAEDFRAPRFARPHNEQQVTTGTVPPFQPATRSSAWGTIRLVARIGRDLPTQTAI